MLSRTGWSRARRQRTPLPSDWTTVLEQQVAYYRCLPDAEQAELRGMLQVLLGELNFEPGAGLDGVDLTIAWSLPPRHPSCCSIGRFPISRNCER